MKNIRQLKQERCTGCAGCLGICPEKAIVMKSDGIGFYYPDVNENYIYTVENREMTGKDISENGIRVALAGNYRATFLEIKRKR